MNEQAILVPIDFSNESHRALEIADAEAARLGSGLILLHVRRMADPPHVQFTFTSAALEKWGNFLRHVEPGKVAYLNLLGDPLEEILKTIDRYQPSRVIMGRGGAQDQLPGPVAYGVKKHFKGRLELVTVRPAEMRRFAKQAVSNRLETVK